MDFLTSAFALVADHERATVGITDNQVADYRRTVELVLSKLFKLKFPKATN